MKYCSNCGKEINEEAAICLNCGCYTQHKTPISEDDAPSIGFAFLGFFFPIVGLILYLVWRPTSPLKAKSVGKGALIGGIAEVCLYILLIVLSVSINLLYMY